MMVEILVLVSGIINLLFTISWYIYTHNMYLEKLEIYESRLKELREDIIIKSKESKYDQYKNSDGLFTTKGGK